VRGLIAALFLVAAASRANADDPRLLLRRGIKMHREASYAASVAALELARRSSSSGELSAIERNEIGFYLAADYVALSSTAAARRELRALFEAQPAYELPPYTSPKVAALCREVQGELERMPRLRALPPRRVDGSRVELWFEPSRTGGTAYGAVSWRWQGEHEWREAPLAHAGDQLVTTIEIDRQGTLEYWAEARGPQGLARSATAERPLELPMTGEQAVPAAPSEHARNLPSVMPAPLTAPAPKRKSVASAWWLWTTVGAVVATAAGVGLYFGLRPQTGGTADAVLDFKVQ
jgi:hypothetical protein